MAPAACRVPLHLPAAGPKIEWNHKEYGERPDVRECFVWKKRRVKRACGLPGCIPGQAIGLGLITVVGQCIGAQDQKAAISYTKKLVGLTYLVDGSLNLAVILGMPLLLGLYNISAETHELAWLLVFIHCVSGIVLWPAAFVLPNALRAANDVRFTMVVSVASMMIWRLGFSYVLGIGFGMGAVGVWIAMIVDWVCRSAFFVGRFVSGKWKTKYKA